MASLSKQEQEIANDKDSGMAKMVMQKVKEFEDFIQDWHKEAKEAYDMVAGKQWADEDSAALEAEQRVPVVFNRIAAFIRGICGMEASNRQSVKYLPREIDDVGGNEVMNSAAMWVRDTCNAEDEESEAFRDMVITGIGSTETRLSYDDDPEGMAYIERRDPLRIGWDPTACKKNVQDSAWRYTFADYSRATFEEKWPDKAQEVFISMFPDENSNSPVNNELAKLYRSDEATSQPDNSIRVVQFQYYKTKVFYRIQDLNGQIQEVPSARFKEMKQFLDKAGMKYAKINKKEYRQCFVAGDVELEDVPLPADEFTIKIMTGIRDRNKGYWYGMVRDAVDPQKWSNKFFSLAIDILATNPKGGLMAESDAFEDIEDAKESWANPREIVVTRPGAIRDGKIQQRTPPAPPPGLDSMMGFAVSSLPQIMGINMEFLGLADRAQAGILESQRKQAAITTLAEFFASLSLYRKDSGRCLMTIILRYLADGRLMRIVGQQNAQYIPLIKQPGFEKFDVIVDEAPNAPDVKQRTFEALQHILPQIMKMGVPIPPEVLDYMPIPLSLSAKWKEMLVKAKEQKLPPQVQQQMQQMQEQLQMLGQENMQLKQGQQMKMAELQSKQEMKMAEMQMQREELVAKLQMQKEESDAQLELKRQIAIADIDIEKYKLAAEAEMEREKAVADYQLQMEKMDTDNQMNHAKMMMDSEAKEKEESEYAESNAMKQQMAKLMQKVDEILSQEKKEPEPKDIKLNYKDGKLIDAVLVKDDGTKVKVTVGRTGQTKQGK